MLQAKKYADEFVQAISVVRNVQFQAVFLYELPGKQFFSAEVWLDGNFQRYTNNAGSVKRNCPNTAVAYSHFTHTRSFS